MSLLALTDTQISTWVAAFILPLFRVTAVLMVMPVFGTTLVPRRVRLYFAVAITVVIARAAADAAGHALDLSGLLLIAEQILIGAVLGFSLQLFFQAFVVAGQIVAIQMGMGFASMVDPTNGVSVAVIGQFFTMLVTLLFLSMNGHLVVFEVLTESFTTLPVGSGWWSIITGSWPAPRLGARCGAAAGVAGDHGVAGGQHRLWRDDPRGAATEHLLHRFPLTLVLGMFIVWVGLADILNQYQPLASEALQFLRELAQAR
jgi:flagellar biosynthetic protein FliR